MTDHINSSLSLHQLLTEVDDAIRITLPSTYWVRAEILQVRHRGYYALELTSYEDQKKAKATAMIWESQADIVSRFEKAAGVRLATGLKVLVRVDVAFHAEYGLRLTVREFDSAFSLGDMEVRLNAIRERLRELGEFNANRELPEPGDFVHVAVIAPQGAAGLGDFRTQADALQAAGLCDFEYFPAIFQSDKNEKSMLDAMVQVINRHQVQPFDAVAIIRGGGDKAGLYELNKMRIARGICRCPLPVLVGVGHERDNTILDEVAHRSFPTPSLVIAHILNAVIDNARQATQDYLQLQKQSRMLLDMAAQECRGHNDRLLRYAFDTVNASREQVQRANRTIRTSPLDILQSMRRHLDALNGSLMNHAEAAVGKLHLQVSGDHALLLTAANTMLTQAREKVDRLQLNLASAAHASLLTQRHHAATQHQAMLVNARSLAQQARYSVQQHGTTIDHLNPRRVLERGFALVFGSDGQVVSSVAAVASKDELKISLRDGSVTAIAKETSNTTSTTTKDNHG